MAESYTERPRLTARFDRALLMAVEHHRRQLRKGTDVPYVAHLLAVAGLVLEMGGTEDEAIAALLHDLVEDGGRPGGARGDPGRVRRRRRARSCTPTATRTRSRSRRGARARRPTSPRSRPSGGDELHVSLADKLHNARAILLDYRTHGERLWDRFKGGEGASVRWYYRALHTAFAARADALGDRAIPALEELGRTVDAIEALAGASAGGLAGAAGRGRGGGGL